MASLMPQGKQRYTDNNGNNLSGGKLWTYEAGSTTPLATYSDQAGATPNANPVVLNARGEATIFWGSAPYKAKLTDASDVEIWTQDNMYAQADASAMASTTSGKGASLVSINDAGSYYSSTTVEGALQEIVGRSLVTVKDARFGTATGDGVTSDQAAVAAAVSYCYSNGDDLYWPDGTYLTTATVANLHDVRHRGPGVVKRGSDLFYVDPKSSQSNTLYIATTGDNANDGLSSSQPRLTFQSAFDALSNYGPVLDGIWSVAAASGTYTISGGQQTHTTQSKNRVVIRGPAAGHPNVPTCIIDGGGNQADYRHGLSASGKGVHVEFRDILAQNFTSASGNTRIGILGENESDVYFNNVHTFACSWTGLYAAMMLRARVSGGIFDGNNISGSSGIITNDTEATIGYQAASTADAPIVKNCTSSGIYWSRGSQGHIDYTTVQDCGVGIDMEQSSSAALPGCNLKRNTVGLRAREGAFYREDGVPVVYNQGTADANTTPFEYYAMGGNGDDLRTAQSYVRFSYDRTTRSASGVVSATFPTIYTMSSDRLNGVGKSARLHAKGVYTVTAGSSLTANFGGMAVVFTVPGAATSAAFELDVELMEVAGGYRAIGRLSAGLSTHRFATATAGFDKTISNAISIGYSLTGAGDSLNIYRSDVYLMG